MRQVSRLYNCQIANFSHFWIYGPLLPLWWPIGKLSYWINLLYQLPSLESTQRNCLRHIGQTNHDELNGFEIEKKGMFFHSSVPFCSLQIARSTNWDRQNGGLAILSTEVDPTIHSLCSEISILHTGHSFGLAGANEFIILTNIFFGSQPTR